MIILLFRVDAGPHIGLGHLQRCLSLAGALRRLGATCIFLTNGDSTVKSRVTSVGFEANDLHGGELGGDGDLKHTLAMAARYRCDVVVVDSYHLDAGYLGRLRASGLFVVVIDDLARYPFPCQLVVNGGAHAYQLPYRSSSGDTTFLLGPPYALLRREFWDVPPRKVHETVQNVLVTVGGADPHNLMPELLGRLDHFPGNFSVTAIMGPFFDNRAEVERAARSCRRSVWLMDAPDSVRDLMLETDLAISAGGHTLYELAAAGTPTVALCLAANQQSNVRAMAERGVVVPAHRAGDVDFCGRLTKAVTRLMKDYEERERMSRAGQQMVDGHGALRVARALP